MIGDKWTELKDLAEHVSRCANAYATSHREEDGVWLDMKVDELVALLRAKFYANREQHEQQEVS